MMLASLLLAAATTLSLAQAEANASSNQPQVRLARASTGAQLARVGEAHSFELPQLTATAGYSRGTANAAAPPGLAAVPDTGPSSFTSYNSLSAGLTATQLIYDFSQTRNRVHAAEEQVKALQFGEHQTELDVIENVRNAFFAAQGALENVDVARTNLKDQDEHLTQIQGFVTAGTHAPVDLAQAKQARADAVFQLVQATGAYEGAKTLLQQAMGIDQEPDFEVSSEQFQAVQGEDAAADGLLPEALKSRPDIARIDAQISAEDFVMTALARGNYPTLGVQASLRDAGYSPSNSAWNGSIGLALQWPLFNGFGAQENAREASYIVVQYRAQRDQLAQQARADVAQALVAIHSAKGQNAAGLESLAYAKERLGLAAARYTAGVGVALDVFDAELAVRNSGYQLTQSNVALATARSQLAHALGRR